MTRVGACLSRYLSRGSPPSVLVYVHVHEMHGLFFDHLNRHVVHSQPASYLECCRDQTNALLLPCPPNRRFVGSFAHTGVNPRLINARGVHDRLISIFESPRSWAQTRGSHLSACLFRQNYIQSRVSWVSWCVAYKYCPELPRLQPGRACTKGGEDRTSLRLELVA